MKQGIDYIGVGVGALIFNDKGELFLMKRGKKAKNEQGHWMIPGGTVEFGDTLKDTVIREIKEEIGCDIEVLEQLPAIDHIVAQDKQHWVSSCFVTNIKKNQIPRILEPEKCDGIGWFPLNELPDPLSIATKLTLEKYYKNHPNFTYEYFLATRVRNKVLIDELLVKLRKKGKKVYWCMETDTYHSIDADPEETMNHMENVKDWKNDEMIVNIFSKDMKALQESEKLIMLLPLPEGKSAHVEAGVAFGLNKKCILIGKPTKAESLYQIFSEQYDSIDDFIKSL